jgi:Arc/MetJ-type ribon-helix-helix transcriptional regulator
MKYLTIAQIMKANEKANPTEVEKFNIRLLEKALKAGEDSGYSEEFDNEAFKKSMREKYIGRD